MSFSLVSTVFNEIHRLDKSLVDVENQSLPPSQIIITDAGSTDGTYEHLQNWQSESKIPITILQEKSCNIARGRNLAIEAAGNELIVSTDFGCRFDPHWLESLIKPFSDPEIMAVGGAFTVVEPEINTLAGRSDLILQKAYPVILDESFSVSSRSIAFRKVVWEKTGGYPEWLTLAADDTIFWKMVKKLSFKYTLIETPYVFWGRHQSNKAFAKEAFRYGRGDGESRINYRNFWSNLIETMLRYLFFISVLLLFFLICFKNSFSSIPIILWFLPLLFLPGIRSYRNAWKNWMTLKSKKYNSTAFLNALLQLEMSRISYLKGYLTGILDRDPKKKKGRQILWEILNK
jgi:glycosyltransferase involved in cell wall biosynthesis